CAEMNGDAGLIEPLADRISKLLVIQRQNTVQRFDDRDIRAHLAEGDAEFETDIAGTNDDELFGNFLKRQRFGRGQDRVAEWQRWQFDRLGAFARITCSAMIITG